MTLPINHFGPIVLDDSVVYVERFNRKVKASELFFDSLQSSNYVAGTSGFRIDSTGAVELNEYVYGGDINAAQITAGTLNVDRIGTNSIDFGTKIELTAALAASQTVQSTTYTPGSAGWSIDADGSAEFQNVTVRGTLHADDVTQGTLGAGGSVALGNLSVTGTLTLSGSGEFRTAADGNTRLEITQSATDRILFFDAADQQQASIGSYSGGTSGVGLTVTAWNTAPTVDEEARLLHYSGGQVFTIGSPDNGSGSFSLVLGGYNAFTHTAVVTIEEDQILGSQHFVAPVGSAATPSYAIDGSGSDTGMFGGATDELGWSTAATKRLGMNNDGIAYPAAATMFPDADFTNPSNHTITTAATWETIGTDSLWTHGGTNRTVLVKAWAAGSVTASGTTRRLVSTRLQISIDGGSTWTTIQAIQQYVDGTSGAAADAIIQQAFSNIGFHTGTATGDVQIRIQGFQGAGTDATFGQVSLMGTVEQTF